MAKHQHQAQTEGQLLVSVGAFLTHSTSTGNTARQWDKQEGAASPTRGLGMAASTGQHSSWTLKAEENWMDYYEREDIPC